MISKEHAMKLRYGQTLHMISYNNNKLVRVRVSGKCQTSKTRPNDFRVPVKYGLYEHGAIDQDNKERFFFTADEAGHMLP